MTSPVCFNVGKAPFVTVQYRIAGNTKHYGSMHLAEFESMLAEKFGGQVRHIRHVNTETGSVKIFFQMPLEYKQKVVKAAKEKADWLLSKRVMSVKVEEEVIDVSDEYSDTETGRPVSRLVF